METFKRIAREALKEVIEEKHVREHYVLTCWSPAEDWQPDIVVTDLCATLVEGSDEESVESREPTRNVIDEICIPTDLTEEDAKREIESQIRKFLPVYKYY